MAMSGELNLRAPTFNQAVLYSVSIFKSLTRNVNRPNQSLISSRDHNKDSFVPRMPLRPV